MAINGLISGTTGISTTKYEEISISVKTATTTSVSNTDAAVFSKSGDDAASSKKTVGKPADPETIERLKAEADQRFESMRGLVEKMLLKQSGTIDLSGGIANIYRSLEVDAETIAKAKEDISEDGYWGVEQTSNRILDFAKALAGEDSELAESMLEAIKEGFKQAEEAWGEELPSLSKDTMDAALKKVQDWIDSLKNPETPAANTTAAGTDNAAAATEETK